MPNTLSPSAAALDLIHEFEQGPQGGMASVPYRCPAGELTIGWGHVIREHERFTMPLTAAQADELLQQDLAQFAAGVNERVTVPLTQAMFDALERVLNCRVSTRTPIATLARHVWVGMTRARIFAVSIDNPESSPVPCLAWRKSR